YALGAILYECLTGRPPFRAETTMATLEQVRRQDPVSPSRLVKKVPRDLETICLKCLAKEPQKRYASAAELGADLYRFLEHEPIRARRAGPVERSAKWVKRHAVAVLATLLAILILAGSGGGFWVWHQRRERLRQEEAAKAESVECFANVV